MSCSTPRSRTALNAHRPLRWRPPATADRRCGRASTGKGLGLAALILGTALHSAVLARDLPDLIIERAELQATGDCSGTAPLIIGTAIVKNVGTGRGQIFTTREMIVVELETSPPLRSAHRFVNSMRPGESVSVPLDIGGSAVRIGDGAYQIRLTVDPRNVFREESETNNTVTMRVVIACR